MADPRETVINVLANNGATLPKDHLINDCVREMLRTNIKEDDIEKFVLGYFGVTKAEHDPDHILDEDGPINRDKVVEILDSLIADADHVSDDFGVEFIDGLVKDMALNKVPESDYKNFISDYLTDIDPPDDE